MTMSEIPNGDNTLIIRVDRLQKELQEKLKKNPENPENIKIRGEIAELRREINRTRQYTSITKETSKKIAEGKDMNTLSAAQLLRIDREEGTRSEFLSKSFLYKQTTVEGNIFQEATDGKNISEGEVLFVDFGKNKSANNKIGLGHMLPIDIGYVKVNGKIGVRSIVNNRVGYYTENNAKGYIPVFTGDTVTIPTATEIANFEKQKDIQLIRNIEQKDSNTAIDASIGRLESSSIETIEINANINESYVFWISNGFTHEQSAGLIANEYQESKCNPKATNGGHFGIFQWEMKRINVIKQGTGIDILTANHGDQLKAALWEITHTSESKVVEPLKKTKTAAQAAAVFVRIFERPGDMDNEVLKRGQMAESFAMLLDTEGRSTNLGDHVVRKGPINLGKDSCGAAVRSLLKSYGITGLPETGADGKNWQSILDERPSQFVKISITHPDQAYPGAILVYNGNGTKGSDMNKAHGHVEIKGSDGKYYSYLESSQAAGSAAAPNEKDPKEYERLTGFIGYAYYPKQKQA